MKQISLQWYNCDSHNVVSLLCTDSSSTLISYDTSTYYSISSSSPESDIMQPHYLCLIVKQHLCILMGSAWRWTHPHSARHNCYCLTATHKWLWWLSYLTRNTWMLLSLHVIDYFIYCSKCGSYYSYTSTLEILILEHEILLTNVICLLTRCKTWNVHALGLKLCLWFDAWPSMGLCGHAI